MGIKRRKRRNKEKVRFKVTHVKMSAQKMLSKYANAGKIAKTVTRRVAQKAAPRSAKKLAVPALHACSMNTNHKPSWIKSDMKCAVTYA